MKTNHYKIYTGYAETETIYQVLLEMAQRWVELKLGGIQIFFAGFTDVYVSIRADKWYHWSVANDPDWSGDAEDILKGAKLLRCKSLSSRPYPERNWRGDWRRFESRDELLNYAQRRLERLEKLVPPYK